jgi:type I restriction enzyme S subunit
MEQFEKLITDLCPNGVPVCALGEIGTIVSGLRSKSKDDFTEGNTPYVSYVEIFNNPGIDFVPEKRVKVESKENQNAIQLGDVLVTGSSETLNECGMTAVVTWEPTLPIYLNSFCFIWRPNNGVELDPHFAKHLFRGRNFRDRVIQTANGVTRQNISKHKFLDIEIPLPPILVQRKVASVLNKFTELEAELEAELESRRIQYEHYRSHLLSFHGVEAVDVPTYPLGEMVEIINGYAFRSSKYSDDGVRVLRITNVQNGRIVDADPKYYPLSSIAEITRYLLREDDLLMSLTGNVGRVGQISSALLPAALNQRVACLRVRDTDKVNLRYLYHLLDDSRFESDCLAAANGSAQANLSTEWLKDYLVQIPPLETQMEIVGILDTFTELEAELEAELKARKSQYEYYRDSLLSFKELEVA